MSLADESAEHLEMFKKIISEYFGKHLSDVAVSTFISPEKMVSHLMTEVYDIIFFNISYNGKSGVKYIYKVRAFNPNIPVVILRFKPDSSIEVVSVAPSVCLAESFTPKGFEPALDIIVSNINTSIKSSIILHTVQDMIRTVQLYKISYIESQKHKIFIYLVNGDVLEMNGPLKTLIERLEVHPEFLYPHRSYIVNAFYISCISVETIYLRSPKTTIPVARGKFKTIMNAYDNYFRNFGRDMNMKFENP